jgi:hypothetical protein
MRRISMIIIELDRLSVLQNLENKQIKVTQAAESMRVSLRHAYRLKNNLKKNGPAGLISRKLEPQATKKSKNPPFKAKKG